MAHFKYFTPTLLALSVAAATSSLSWAQETPADTAKQKAEEVEIIEVKGLRGSIVRSTLLKQTADSLIDVISAEDIGNFPDSNVVDSMQRVTGIQIDRDDSGEASGFQVRGISQNRVELNGRTLAGGEGEGRNANLSDIPSELIDSLEVIKSPTADLIEGSLGATINLKTKRPLAMKDGRVTVNGKLKYADNVKKSFANLNAIYANKWMDTDNGDFGFLINATYNDNEKAGDIIRANGWGEKCDNYVKGANGTIDKVNNNACDNLIFAPNQFVHLQNEESKLQESLTTTFQWRPDSDSEYLFEVSYIHKDNQRTRDTLTINNLQTNDFIDPDVFDAEADENGIYHAFSNIEYNDSEVIRYNNFGEVNNIVTPVTAFDSSAAFVNQTAAQGNTLETKAFSFALEGKWYLENMKISAEGNYSTSEHERHYFASTLNRYAGNVTNQNDQTFRVDEGEGIRGTGYDLSADLSDPRLIELFYNGSDLNDPRYLRLNATQDDGWVDNQDEAAVKVDFDYDLDKGDITTLEFGFRATQRTAERPTRFRFRCQKNNNYGGTGPNANSYQEGVDAACEDPSFSAVDLMASNPDAFKHVDDFYTDQGVNSIDNWLQLSQDFYFNNQQEWQDVFGFTELGFTEAPEESYKITEDTAAAYIKANLSGDIGDKLAYRGNIGVRGVYTKAEVITTPGAVDEDGELLKSVEDHEYVEWLPSFNLAVVHELGLVRFAAAKVMVRPNFSELRTTGSFNNFTGCNVYDPSDPFNEFNNGIPNGNLSAAEQERQQAQNYLLNVAQNYEGTNPCPGIRGFGTNIGNIALDPYISYNYDLSFEKYWGKGNSASIAFFYRDVQADLELERGLFVVPVNEADQYVGEEGSGYLEGENISAIEGGELWRVRTNVNGGKSVRQGVELSYTQFFDFLPEAWSGLGVTLNYTYSDGSRPDAEFVDDNEDIINFSDYGIDASSYEEKLAGAIQLQSDGEISTVSLKDEFSLLPIEKLSRHSGNFSLFYDKDKINARLSYNYRSEYYLSGTLSNPIYQDAQERVDFSSNYRWSKALTLRFDVQNLTNQAEHRYIGNQAITERSYYSDRIFSLGAQYSF